MAKINPLLMFLVLFSFAVHAQDSSGKNSTNLSRVYETEIRLTSRSDVKDHRKIVLEWNCPPLKEAQFFTIERSKDGKDFDVIAVIKGIRHQAFFEFTDELPANTNNFYRIKTTFSENQPVYSKIVSRGVSVVQFCRFYPNPVEKYLIVRTESPVELKVTDQLNKVRISKQLQVGLQLVDVNSLEKGLYIITLFQKESNRLITEKLMKN